MLNWNEAIDYLALRTAGASKHIITRRVPFYTKCVIIRCLTENTNLVKLSFRSKMVYLKLWMHWYMRNVDKKRCFCYIKGLLWKTSCFYESRFIVNVYAGAKLWRKNTADINMVSTTRRRSCARKWTVWRILAVLFRSEILDIPTKFTGCGYRFYYTLGKFVVVLAQCDWCLHFQNKSKTGNFSVV